MVIEAGRGGHDTTNPITIVLLLATVATACYNSRMRWLAVLAIIFGLYYYFLTYSMNVVLNQVQTLHQTYTYVANNADRIATGE